MAVRPAVRPAVGPAVRPAVGPAVACCWICFNETKLRNFRPFLSLEKKHKSQGLRLGNYGGLVWLIFGSSSKSAALQGRCDVTDYHGAGYRFVSKFSVFSTKGAPHILQKFDKKLNSPFALQRHTCAAPQQTPTNQTTNLGQRFGRKRYRSPTICLAIPELPHRWAQ
jgi:hypothetical protein